MGHPKFGGGESLECHYERRWLMWLILLFVAALVVPGAILVVLQWGNISAALFGLALSAYPAGVMHFLIRELLADGPVLVIGKNGIWSRRIGPAVIPWNDISAIGVTVEGAILLNIATVHYEKYDLAPYLPLRLVKMFTKPVSMQIEDLDKTPGDILEAVGKFYTQSESEAQSILDFNPVVGRFNFKPLIWIGKLFGVLGDDQSLRQKLLGAALWSFFCAILGVIMLAQAADPWLRTIVSEIVEAPVFKLNDLLWSLVLLTTSGGLIWRVRKLRSLYLRAIPLPSETEKVRTD